MDASSEHNDHSESVVDGPTAMETSTTENSIVPGVTVVRGNTPRPRTHRQTSAKADSRRLSEQSLQSSTTDFPSEAPEAPPLPEEYDDGETSTPKQQEFVPSLLEGKQESSNQETSEFMWLFEYGLEMETAYLNSAERLNGLALMYGPAVLRGYRIVPDGVEVSSGEVAATIIPMQQSDAEVWGVLYRVPCRLAERNGDELSLLEKTHGATVFAPLEVTVHEIYRKREVACVTYVAPVTNRQPLQWPLSEQQGPHAVYAQQLLASATRQKLPDDYLAKLKRFAAAEIEQEERTLEEPVERNTEPLPVVKGAAGADSVRESTIQQEQDALQVRHPTRSLSAFALYLVLLLLATFTLALLQALGYWNDVFSVNFAVLAVPWYVLIYGLLGACVSGILTLGKYSAVRLPGFVVMTWFARPFIGIILAALAYLLLNSGLFMIADNAGQHYSLNALIGALAGFCEGWVYFRKR